MVGCCVVNDCAVEAYQGARGSLEAVAPDGVKATRGQTPYVGSGWSVGRVLVCTVLFVVWPSLIDVGG